MRLFPFVTQDRNDEGDAQWPNGVFGSLFLQVTDPTYPCGTALPAHPHGGTIRTNVSRIYYRLLADTTRALLFNAKRTFTGTLQRHLGAHLARA